MVIFQNHVSLPEGNTEQFDLTKSVNKKITCVRIDTHGEVCPVVNCLAYDQSSQVVVCCLLVMMPHVLVAQPPARLISVGIV